jgi:hypothetical protein
MLLLILSSGAALASPVRPKVDAVATVRVERNASTASAEQWERQPASSRRQVIVRDERGQPVLLRVIDNP